MYLSFPFCWPLPAYTSSSCFASFHTTGRCSAWDYPFGSFPGLRSWTTFLCRIGRLMEWEKKKISKLTSRKTSNLWKLEILLTIFSLPLPFLHFLVMSFVFSQVPSPFLRLSVRVFMLLLGSQSDQGPLEYRHCGELSPPPDAGAPRQINGY